MNVRRYAAVGMALMATTSAAGAQPAERAVRTYDLTQFVQLARQGTSRFQKQQQAIDEGFTRVGVEFPAMGEHWVSFARILENVFNPEQPSVLIYVNTARGPELAGVAYSRLLSGRTAPPAFPFPGAWHEHNGAVNEESLPIGHTAHASPPNVSDGTLRLFVLHAWIWSANPTGTFATDNWALPLRRLQSVGPRPSQQPISRAAIMTIALAEDDADYFRLVIGTTLGLSDGELGAVSTVLDDYRERAKRLVEPLRDGRTPSAVLADRLAAQWRALWASMEAALPRRVTALRRLRAQM